MADLMGSVLISRNTALGRHLTATRPIRKGEIIFIDSPLLLGPKIASVPVCLGCHRNLPTTSIDAHFDFYHCRRCGWPMCDSSCEAALDHREECALLARTPKSIRSEIHFRPDDPHRKESLYCVIVPLRALLLKRSNPQRFRDVFLSLESHLEARIKTPLYAALRSNLVPFVRDFLGMGKEATEHELLQIAAILDTNCYEVRLPDRNVKVRALYELGSMMSHDCRPNTKHYFDERLRLLVVATVDIPEDATISISYTQPLLSTIQRRYAIKQAKCFECCCDRCQDPTELFTYAGSIVCPLCHRAKLTAFDPLDMRSDWHCENRKCPFRESACDAVRRNEQLQATMMALARADSPREEYERFLTTHQQPSTGLLHPWNTNVLQVKYALTQLYRQPGAKDEKAIVSQPEAQLRRQIELCRDLLKVADHLEPGFSPFRGKLLVELRDALLILRDQKHQDLSQWSATASQEHVHPAMSTAITKSKQRQRRQRRGKIDTEAIGNSGEGGGQTTKQLLQDVEAELAEMRKSDPTLDKFYDDGGLRY
ncbi:SET domain-containing protein SmydA-8 isoform X2 [Armigeres subalbatus]|uniref:SET domain-containing protein SmydA-8 isoform X2 n=1 Tax=Armigeres subalbatus TaxID=124917 RepID=UPI002ED5F3EB